ncbi:hypothetical protein [Bacillus sp. SH5-2]|nr:hypothetical protein [Bacillus sp. SH5-2]
MPTSELPVWMAGTCMEGTEGTDGTDGTAAVILNGSFMKRSLLSSIIK